MKKTILSLCAICALFTACKKTTNNVVTPVADTTNYKADIKGLWNIGDGSGLTFTTDSMNYQNSPVLDNSNRLNTYSLKSDTLLINGVVSYRVAFQENIMFFYYLNNPNIANNTYCGYFSRLF